MGFYDRHILPRLLNAAMSTKPITYQRKKVVPRAEGRVLEIGFGAGHNLPFYDAAKVSHIWALEPAAEMRARAAERVAASPISLEFLDLPGEQIPLGDAEADTVLVTYTLCSIPDVHKALGEMRRVMKPATPDAAVESDRRRLPPGPFDSHIDRRWRLSRAGDGDDVPPWHAALCGVQLLGRSDEGVTLTHSADGDCRQDRKVRLFRRRACRRGARACARDRPRARENSSARHSPAPPPARR
jgi:SAM-dependent methyltransferase